ncbi:Uncharacterized protein OBRU01_12920 [Operophtera brumata]|uniref:Zinc finger protein 106 n=1 Tax=Operophtera brumata TaxID=104452 RepID=A0A0L7L8T3_OPEBR|nr:Uncharacterized protein OBRU01_12920 [Operophtera brumata]
MKRGHPGTWRGENPRHFRPRGGGPPHFRPSMPFGPLEPHRFPPPAQRYRGPRSYNSHPIHSDDSGPPDHERQFRGPGYQMRSQERGNHDIRERQMQPLLQMRLQESNRGGPFSNPNFFGGNQYNTNNMGDVDHRACDVDLRQQAFGPRQPSPWVTNPLFERRYFNNDKSPHKTFKQFVGDTLLPPPEHTGHRPPSSDHYSGTSGPNNNNNPYSRSVDDTVDIVRKRLLNKDSQEHPDPSMDQREMNSDFGKNADEVYHDAPQEQPVKKKVQRQRQIKSNCDKIKNKIVHQLFKMDKGKIHKLMDNPSSSSKFEYAISSLITESQNSLNRHMRSVAEKSLSTTSSSSDFIHDDNNTIYEDTFMRQMQGILDPQDTLLLEDIKPLVLAELSKVLCLDDFGRCEGIDDHGRYPTDEDNHGYYNESGEYLHNTFCERDQVVNHDTEVITGDLHEERKFDCPQKSPFEEPAPLFERRPTKQLDCHDDRSRSRSTERMHSRKSFDNNSIKNESNDKFKESKEPLPLFDGNCDHFSEDDDPFAELDNQYHVAVDHDFIERGDIMFSPIVDHSAIKSPPITDRKDVKLSLPLPDSPSTDIVNEIDTQLQSIAKSPLKHLSTFINERENSKSNAIKVKQEIQEIQENVSAIKDTLITKSLTENAKVKQEPSPTKEHSREPVKHAHDFVKHNSRKRSVDTKPSHRKEKRKKSSHSECHEAATSIFNMFYDSKSPTKDSKTIDSVDKEYSDKYVKRKEIPKKPKDKVLVPPKSDTQKRRPSNTSHSITSPKDTCNSSVGDQTQAKLDKVKLTAIDIFSGGSSTSTDICSGGTKPKKGHVSQAHRNTTITKPQPGVKSPDIHKNKSAIPKMAPVLPVASPIIPVVTSFARKLTKRHMGTQVIRKLHNKECQTSIHKKNSCWTQTDPVKFEKTQWLSADPLERMKEIDMEIQMLLQEKFKLYNSMETNNKNTMSSGRTMGTLGMAVLNVPIETDENDKGENDDLLADAIAENFTSLPVEELEQIAMETIEPRKKSSPSTDKRGRRQKEQSRKISASPTSRNKKAKLKTPNISLLEQIIEDDRPIEEIISLVDLESTPTRSKKKSLPRSSKKKSSKKLRPKPFVLGQNFYDLKDCSVVIERLDLDAYLKARANRLKIKINLKSITIQDNPQYEAQNENASITGDHVRALSPILETIFPDSLDRPSPEPSIVEEPVNDIQIDMMEVCEDIVIGDESKNTADVNERVPISEEIILDNSQSSAENSAPEVGEGECKMYDYATDELLKRDAVTVTGNADAVLAIETGLERGPECNVLSPIQTMDRAWDTVFVGTRTGFVLQFECKNDMLIPVSTVKFSEQSILALRAMKEGPRKVLLVAARSDNVTIKDAQTGLLLRTLEGPKMTVYSLLFEDGKSGGHVHAHEGGKGAVCLRATGGLVFAGCYDGCVYVYREGETRPLAQLRGPALMLLSLAIQGTKVRARTYLLQIIAGYKDRSLYIWKIPLAVVQEMIL